MQIMNLGPMPDKIPDNLGDDDKYWNARKSLSYTLKNIYILEM